MLQITKKADYGILILTHMIRAGRAGISAKELASDLHLSLPFVSNILKSLARNGILQSRRGSTGGYSLKRLPSEISFAEVLEGLDGDFRLTECTFVAGKGSAAPPSPRACKFLPHCSAFVPIRRVYQKIRDLLAQVTLEELSRSEPTTPPSIKVSQDLALSLVGGS